MCDMFLFLHDNTPFVVEDKLTDVISALEEVDGKPLNMVR